MPHTLEETIKELERELQTRKRVYPEWIRMQRINQKTAEQRISLMQNAIELLKKQVPTQTKLF